MKTKKIFIAVILVLALITSVFVFLNNQPGTIKNDPVLTNDNDNDLVGNEKPDNGKKLSCYDAINTLLEKDGFTYLEGTKWGRGEKNFFMVDLESQEFQLGDFLLLETLPEDWYKENFDRYVTVVYKHKTVSVDVRVFDGTKSYVASTNDKEGITQPTSNYRDFPVWMDYYVSQFENYGCSIANEFNVDKLEEYKTKMSKTTEQGIVSVFDLKSTDGIIRNYNDVHQEGSVKEHPRYKELNSFEDFLALKSKTGAGLFLSINIINSDKTKDFETDSDSISAKAIEEFVKDVVYAFTPEPDGTTAVRGIGVYFIDVDNPNGNFKSLYEAPIKSDSYDFDLTDDYSDLREFSSPFEGTIIEANRDDTTGYQYTPLSITEIEHVLTESLKNVVFVNPSVVFSEDFIWNYTRPFAYEWQKYMGLTKLFDTKYGQVDHSIEYMN